MFPCRAITATMKGTTTMRIALSLLLSFTLGFTTISSTLAAGDDGPSLTDIIKGRKPPAGGGNKPPEKTNPPEEEERAPAQGMTPLMQAAARHDFEAVKNLLWKGARASDKDSE